MVGLLGAGESVLQGSQERGTGTVFGGPREDLEAVGRGQALPPVEQTPPPALAFRHVLFQNGQDVSFAESQLIGAVRVVVIKCPSQERLGVRREKEFIVVIIHPCTDTAQSDTLEPFTIAILSPFLVPRGSGPCSLPDSFLLIFGVSGDMSHPQGSLTCTLRPGPVSLTCPHGPGLICDYDPGSYIAE